VEVKKEVELHHIICWSVTMLREVVVVCPKLNISSQSLQLGVRHRLCKYKLLSEMKRGVSDKEI
jgi:hypothetical protein